MINDGPAVRGGAITFSATVYYEEQIVENEKFEFIWEDDAIPRHIRDVRRLNNLHNNNNDLYSVLGLN